MNFHFRASFASLWSRADPVLAKAGLAGELLAVRVIRRPLWRRRICCDFLGNRIRCHAPETGILAPTHCCYALYLGPHRETVYVTISAGLATFPHDGKDPAILFATADERMFQAKNEGRKRAVASTALAPEAAASATF